MLADLADGSLAKAISADVCIIGAGPAGLVAAHELSSSFDRVCLLESGGLAFEDATQSLYNGADVGVKCDLVGGRLRMLGGSSNHWGGRCGLLDDSDFEIRNWVPFSGWPFGRGELTRFYARARSACGLSTTHAAVDIAAEIAARGFSPLPEGIVPFAWQYTGDPTIVGLNFRDQNIDFLKKSHTVMTVLHANVLRFVVSMDSASIKAVEAVSLNGNELTVSAKHIILCCGGLENARLLLVGDGDRAVGNEGDNVGRFLMQHPRARAATIFHPSVSFCNSFNDDFFGDMGKPATPTPVEVGLTLSPAIRRRDRLLGCSASFILGDGDGVGLRAAHELAIGLEAGYWPAETGRLYLQMLGDIRSIYDLARQRVEQTDRRTIGTVDVIIDLEQVPDRASRVTLDTDVDALGMRRLKADWRIGELERKTASTFVEYLAAAVQNLGGGRLHAEPWISSLNAPSDLAATYHYIGTTRMADSQASGVVDQNCRVFSMSNLFLAGSSVFPTSGHVNPTLTIIALTMRLCDYIKSIG